MGGIKQHGNGIQITFYWNGIRYRPTLKIPYTPSNIKFARQLKGEVERSIALGNYTLDAYAAHFPTSRVAKAIPAAKAMPTFGEIAKTWLMTIDNLAAGSKLVYRTLLNFWLLRLDDKPINQINHSTLLAIANKQGWSEGHRNSMLVPLRRIFDLAMRDGIIKNNPTVGIDNGKVQKPPPDPFTIEEVNLILERMAKTYSEQVLNYFEFAFFTGARPEEQIALKWSEIDFVNGLARIRRVRTAMTDRETTKTSSIRDIALNSRAIAALQRQKAFTFIRDDYVFNNPATKRRFIDSDYQRENYWMPTLKVLGLRYRVPYHARHTYATMNLMAGANPMWVSKMMGHINMEMLLTTYSKWIDGADKNQERAKIEALFDGHSHKDATRIDKNL